MGRTPASRVLAVVAAMAVIALASATLAHSHRGARPVDESHCGICLSAHSGTNGITSAPASLHFVPLVSRYTLQISLETFVSIQSRPAQDRAPPTT